MAQRRLYMKCLHPLSSKEFREGLWGAMLCAEKHQIKQWLLDLRETGELEEEEEAWLQLHFFPLLMIKLGTGNHLAIVLSEHCFNKLLHQAGGYGLQSYNEVIIMKNFREVEEAVSWLDTVAAAKS